MGRKHGRANKRQTKYGGSTRIVKTSGENYRNAGNTQIRKANRINSRAPITTYHINELQGEDLDSYNRLMYGKTKQPQSMDFDNPEKRGY